MVSLTAFDFDFEEGDEGMGIGVGMRMGSGRKLLYSFRAPFCVAFGLDAFLDGPAAVLGILKVNWQVNKGRDINVSRDNI